MNFEDINSFEQLSSWLQLSIAFISYKNTCLTIHAHIVTYMSCKKKIICIPSEAYKEDQSNGSNLYDKT